MYHHYVRHKRNKEDFANVEHLRNEIDRLISKSNKEYYQDINRKLNDPLTSSKTYWSIMKTFFYVKKVPVIPPLLFNSAFVTDFEEKSKIFNSFFAKQCTLLSNNSVLPSEFTYMTEERIQSITFSESDVIKIIRTLNVNKAHGHDNISVRMIKLCINTVALPLTLFFQNSVAAGTFPTQWKRANIVPIHKKNDKQIVSNYRPVSLLPICSKIFEKLIFNELFKIFEDNNLLSKHQSNFRPGDSCIYQLLAITHDIFSSFDCNPTLETRSVFLDISKAFDRVWHDGLLLKLEKYGVSGNLFQLIKSSLSGRFQRVLLNGQTSDWETIQAGVPQGSILGPLFFLIYINDLTDNLNSNAKLFANDTSLFSEISDPLETANVLNNDLRKIREWTEQWKMVFNPDSTKQVQDVTFSRKSHSQKHLDLYFNSLVVEKVKTQKHLGLKLDEKLNFKEHLKDKFAIVNKGIGMLKKLSNCLPRHSLATLDKAFIRPHLDYGDIIYDKPNNMNICNKIEILQ